MVNVMKWIKRWCFLLALSLLVLPVRAQAAVYEGLDVSVWQGEIVLSPIRCKTLLDGGRRRTKNLYGVF